MTLHPALTIGWLVGRLVGHILLFLILFFWRHCSCPNGQVTSTMAPAHLHATSVDVYPALFCFFVFSSWDPILTFYIARLWKTLRKTICFYVINLLGPTGTSSRFIDRWSQNLLRSESESSFLSPFKCIVFWLRFVSWHFLPVLSEIENPSLFFNFMRVFSLLFVITHNSYIYGWDVWQTRTHAKTIEFVIYDLLRFPNVFHVTTRPKDENEDDCVA